MGMHYTSVPNILKVLNPLFLDDLREKLEEAGGNLRKLLNLRNRMAKIRVFDPAAVAAISLSSHTKKYEPSKLRLTGGVMRKTESRIFRLLTFGVSNYTTSLPRSPA